MSPEAQKLLLKAKLLRLFAIVFAFAGLVVFIALYFQHIEGTFFSALTNPFVVFIVILPFLPAVVLSMRASKLERDASRKFADKK